MIQLIELNTYLVFCSPHPRTSRTEREESVLVTRRRAKVSRGVWCKAHFLRRGVWCKAHFLTDQTNTILSWTSCASEKHAIYVDKPACLIIRLFYGFLSKLLYHICPFVKSYFLKQTNGETMTLSNKDL